MSNPMPRRTMAATAGIAMTFALLSSASVRAQTAPVVPAAPAAPASVAAPATPVVRGLIPGRSETPMEAFNKLTRNNASYLTREDVAHLEGFDTAFTQADQNGDGRLNAAEFNTAWTMYIGNRP